MANGYLPTREAELVTWSKTFGTYISANEVQVGLTIEQAGAYDALQSSFAAAYQTANDPATRSPANIESKNLAKNALVEETRQLVAIVQAFPGTTNTMRSAMGITVRDNEPTPVPVPVNPPQLDIVSVQGRTVKMRLRNAINGERRKPAGVQGATVLSYVGETIPGSLRDWTFEGNTTRLDVPVVFSESVPMGSKVWIAAFWYNRRAESGPASSPVAAHVGFGGMVEEIPNVEEAA